MFFGNMRIRSWLRVYRCFIETQTLKLVYQQASVLIFEYHQPIYCGVWKGHAHLCGKKNILGPPLFLSSRCSRDCLPLWVAQGSLFSKKPHCSSPDSVFTSQVRRKMNLLTSAKFWTAVVSFVRSASVLVPPLWLLYVQQQKLSVATCWCSLWQ